MSHSATNWAIKQRGLKPAAKIVLWHLADCHNEQTGQCNPRQKKMAELCEMSRATLSRHLANLEKRGLIKRRSSYDPVSHRRQSTHYTLAFDGPLEDPESQPDPMSQNATRPQDVADPCLKTRQGTMSQPCDTPCLTDETYHVSKFDKKNPGKEPGKEPCAARAAAHTQDMDGVGDGDIDAVLSRFLEVYPRIGDRAKTREALGAALASGVPAVTILAAARSYAAEQEGNARQYIAYSENWLGQRLHDDQRGQGAGPGGAGAGQRGGLPCRGHRGVRR